MIWFFLLLFLVGCATPPSVTLGDIRVSVEIADEPAEQTRGLMFREDLCETCGMLFLFDDEVYRTFWMKNTRIPLEMIFISTDWRIIDIQEAVPCTTLECSAYTSKEKAQYVLEVNKGFSQKYKVATGDLVIKSIP